MGKVLRAYPLLTAREAAFLPGFFGTGASAAAGRAAAGPAGAGARQAPPGRGNGAGAAALGCGVLAFGLVARALLLTLGGCFLGSSIEF